MHPPLDRPHPDCQVEIAALRDCHLQSGWWKYTGACNKIKVVLDQCLRLEKKRLLSELNRELPQKQLQQQDLVKKAFGKEMTFAEYLQSDPDYRSQVGKKGKTAASSSPSTSTSS